jgi:hypothetical protein
LIGGAAICCIQEPKQPAAQRFGAGLSVAAGAHHRPIRPRGTFDIMARLIGQWLTEKLGQPFVIENRPGAGGNIGTEAVVRAPADGYALLLVGTANAISVTLYEKLNFNFIRDIVPVAGIARVPEVMLVNPSLPATTVRELIAYAKANAGKLTMASGGIGTLSHLASPSSALFRRERDRGEPPMLNASVRPQPTAVAAVSALAATAGKTSSDEILVEQIAAGSKPAMQALFARHRTYVYRWLLRFVSNETLAEDLLNEVFLDVWRQAGRFQCRSSVSTWLMSIGSIDNRINARRTSSPRSFSCNASSGSFAGSAMVASIFSSTSAPSIRRRRADRAL